VLRGRSGAVWLQRAFAFAEFSVDHETAGLLR
jgi:hypothetical protein